MAYKEFICAPNDFFHVTNRCHNKDWFGLDMETVWNIFARNLHFVSSAFGIKIHAFVLMSNHYHLLVSTPNANLSDAIGYFQLITTKEINFLKGTINQLWGGRFKRCLIDSEKYFVNAYKYIYRNPVEAGVCEKVEDYPWSSLQFLLGKKRFEFPVFDDLVDEITAPKELLWLNSYPGDEKIESVRKALAKRKFSLPKVNQRQNPIELDGF